MSVQKQVITFSDLALHKLKSLIQGYNKDLIGIRVSVKSGGCSGFKYVLEYASTKNQYDEIIEQDGITLLIDPKALMYLIGTEMDYQESEAKAGFVFTNPNEKGRCGCGKSFSVWIVEAAKELYLEGKNIIASLAMLGVTILAGNFINEYY